MGRALSTSPPWQPPSAPRQRGRFRRSPPITAARHPVVSPLGSHEHLGGSTFVTGEVMSSLLRLLRPLGVGAYALTVATAFFPPPSVIRRHRSAPLAIVSLDTAIARMGGKDALERIERVRFEMMTLWQRLTFDDRPTDLIGTYELHSDLRNYTLGAWRNTRRFVSGPALQEGTDIVLRDVAIRRLPPRPDGTASPWAPLSIAYVDERKEVFAFAPERLLLA